MANVVSSVVASECLRGWPGKVLALGGPVAVFEAVTVAVGGDDLGVVAEPVEEAGAGCLVG